MTCFLSSFVQAAEAGGYWSAKEPLPMEGWGIATANDKIYLIGTSGDYGNSSYVNKGIFEYNPLLDSWNLKTSMPISRAGFATASLDNKIYIIGGLDGLNQVYDPVTEKWGTKTSVPTPRTQLEANVVGGKVYLIGGRTGGQYSTVGLNEVYDPVLDSWETKASIPYPVTLYASAVFNNKIYIFGGQDEFVYPPNIDLVQIYDPANDTWSSGTPMPTVVWQAAAGATSGRLAVKRIYLIGGMMNESLEGTSVTQIYNPTDDSWSVGEDMPTARFKLRVAVINDKLYAMGGSPYLNLEGINSLANEEYTPVGYGTADPSYATANPESSDSNPSGSQSSYFLIIVSVSIVIVAIVTSVLLIRKYKRPKS